MPDPLATYLHDHLGGATFAIDLVEQLAKDPDLHPFAASLLLRIEEDRRVVRELAERLGAGSNVIKEATAWVAEKASRVKLGHQMAGPVGRLEALESLALGILGKLALWHSLQIAASVDARLHGLDFEALIARAGEQHALVEKHRLRAARDAFAGPSTSGGS